MVPRSDSHMEMGDWETGNIEKGSSTSFEVSGVSDVCGGFWVVQGSGPGFGELRNMQESDNSDVDYVGHHMCGFRGPRTAAGTLEVARHLEFLLLGHCHWHMTHEQRMPLLPHLVSIILHAEPAQVVVLFCRGDR